MTQGKHTQGPWQYTPTNTEHVSHIVRAADGFGVATATPQGGATAYNARLIAAAPDMLEACQIISDCASSAKGMTAAQVRIALDMAANTARAAIARATGEKP